MSLSSDIKQIKSTPVVLKYVDTGMPITGKGISVPLNQNNYSRDNQDAVLVASATGSSS